MKIQSVKSTVVAIPITRPTAMATRTLRKREYVLTTLITDDGVEGIGFTYAGTNGGRVVQACVETILAAQVIGQDPHYTELIWNRMFTESLLIGRRGAAIRAMAAIDIAIWDILGKAHGQPVYRLLGAYRDQVPAYASGGYYRTEGNPLEEIQREMGRYLERGFVNFKMKVGGLPLAQDRERVRVARETIGPMAKLALDANNAYNDLPTAMHAAEVFAPYDIWWFEEPTYPDSLPHCAEVARRAPMPVATGEIEGTRWGFRDMILAGAAQILQPDAVAIGGITEFVKVAHLAAGHDLQIAPHSNAEIHVHLLASAPNGLTAEYMPVEEGIRMFEKLVDPEKRLVVKEGVLQVPQQPGLGLELSQREVDKYRIG
ncbi:MAG: mandelate racemase/muconate lactonizing enzyme family protein [Chloroflexota bacterium]